MRKACSICWPMPTKTVWADVRQTHRRIKNRAIALGNAEVAKTLCTDASEDDKEALAMRQANAAVMLLRMDAAEQVWPLLKHSPDPRVRSYIIHWLSPRGGDPKTIIDSL